MRSLSEKTFEGTSSGGLYLRQCIFTSDDSPCDLCRELGREKSCIKMWGPKTSETIKVSTQKVSMFEVSVPDIVPETNEQSASACDQTSHSTANAMIPFPSLDLSRPVTVYDSSIDPMDAHILQRGFRVFNDSSFLTRVLIPKFALAYGPSITHPSLRQAVILFCRTQFPEFSEPNHITLQRRRACLALGRRLKRPNILDEGDLFSAYFIALHCKLQRSDKAEKHMEGVLALTKHLLTFGSVSNSTFYIFWRMLMWDMATWSEAAVVLVPGPLMDMEPSHYRQWCLALGKPISVFYEPIFAFVSSYFLFLRDAYLASGTPLNRDLGRDRPSHHRMTNNIRASLNSADEHYGYSVFESFISELNQHHLVASWFRMLFTYYLCHLLLSALPLSGEDLNLPFAGALRLLTFFRNIECIVDRVESRWVNDIEVLSDPTSKESPDTLLYGGSLHFIFYVDL